MDYSGTFSQTTSSRAPALSDHRVAMALVSFTLNEEGVGAFNDALLCIHKFSDDVSLEIKKDIVRYATISSQLEALMYEYTRMLTCVLDLVGSYCTQSHQVRICLLHLRRKQILLTFLIRGKCAVPREVLLCDLHQGKYELTRLNYLAL